MREPAKIKLTRRVDEDVARFFRALGAGHLTRMNAVLRAFMHARLAGVVKGPEAVDYAPTPMERYLVEAAGIVEAMQKRNLRAARWERRMCCWSGGFARLSRWRRPRGWRRRTGCGCEGGRCAKNAHLLWGRSEAWRADCPP